MPRCRGPGASARASGDASCVVLWPAAKAVDAAGRAAIAGRRDRSPSSRHSTIGSSYPSAQLLEQGQRRARAAQLAGCLGLLTAVGALAGAALLGAASRTTLAAVLAFGGAALLYLVVEELLVEAHETDETPLLAAIPFS